VTSPQELATVLWVGVFFLLFGQRVYYGAALLLAAVIGGAEVVRYVPAVWLIIEAGSRDPHITDRTSSIHNRGRSRHITFSFLLKITDAC